VDLNNCNSHILFLWKCSRREKCLFFTIDTIF